MIVKYLRIPERQTLIRSSSPTWRVPGCKNIFHDVFFRIFAPILFFNTKIYDV